MYLCSGCLIKNSCLEVQIFRPTPFIRGPPNQYIQPNVHGPLAGSVGPASQNSYPIYDQNL